MNRSQLIQNAVDRATKFLTQSTWAFGHYSNAFHDLPGPSEPTFAAPAATDDLVPYLDSFNFDPADKITSYNLNDAGLQKLRMTFQNLGSGQLVGRLYNDLQPANGGLAEEYLVTVSLPPVIKASEILGAQNFAVTMTSLADDDYGVGAVIGGLDLHDGTLTMTENTRYLPLNMTSTTDMILYSN